MTSFLLASKIDNWLQLNLAWVTGNKFLQEINNWKIFRSYTECKKWKSGIIKIILPKINENEPILIVSTLNYIIMNF